MDGLIDELWRRPDDVSDDEEKRHDSKALKINQADAIFPKSILFVPASRLERSL